MTAMNKTRGDDDRHRRWLLMFTLCALIPVPNNADAASDTVKRYALIVANNLSLDDGVAPLRFADDDGARYFELFEAAGAQATLLTTLDADAQSRYPGAAEAALPPSSEALDHALSDIFRAVEADARAGATVHFYFVYAGHGSVGPNQEGYLNLLDVRFGRKMLFSRIVAKSKATFNHLILDACHAFFMVNKRGNQPDKTGDFRDDVRTFLKSESLARYPNTGVILAASSESETHEWQRLEAGIFSHEVRSALLGAGDVNNDGLVTYAEAAAFVEAANAAIDVPRARLKVFAHPPAQQLEVPLMATTAFQESVTLTLPTTHAGRYHVEDGRGVRTLDLNYSSEQSVKLKLVGEAPFYIRRPDDEAIITAETVAADISSLRFMPLTEGHRGSVETSFRRHLFEIPFGVGFYRGMIAREGRLTAPPKMAGGASTPPAPPTLSLKTDGEARPKRRSLRRPLGFASLGCGLAFGASSGIVYALARREYNEYMKAKTRTDAKALHASSDTLLNTSRALLGVGVGMTILGAGLWISDLLRRPTSKRTSARRFPMPFGDIGDGQTRFGVTHEF